MKINLESAKSSMRSLFEILVFGGTTERNPKPYVSPDDAWKYDYRDDLRALKDKYGIDIETKKDPLGGSPFYEEADAMLVAGAAGLLLSELSVYPSCAFKKMHIEKVVLCRDLTCGGTVIGGMADMPVNTIFLNVQCVKGAWRTARRNIHHEFFHAIDYNDDWLKYFDPWWESFNEKSFRYSQDHIKAGAPRSTGFISNYAMKTAAEDKAELFAELIVNYDGVENICKTDAIVRTKVSRMKQLLNTFSIEFNEYYWLMRKNSNGLQPSPFRV